MKNQKRNTLTRGIFLTLSFFIGFGLDAQNLNEASKPHVYHIQNSYTEAYLVKGSTEKLILIETGVPTDGYKDSLVNSIKKLGFKPENISLAIVTHGHNDHAGNARYLQETYHIAIAGSKADLGKFTSGKTELAKCEDISIWGKRLRPYCDVDYPPFTPDVLVDNAPIDLAGYGVNGKIIPIKGGHTPGDLLVLIGDNLFVGDAFMGTFKGQGGGLVPDGHQVREHIWLENKQLADDNLKVIEKIAIDNKVALVYPTHNGPVTTSELTKYIKAEPLLKLLSKQQPAMLNDAVTGKVDLQNTLLADNFIFQAADNTFYSKAEFIAAYITHPKTKIESLAAEDFRIVSSNENTIVMTYLQTTKLQGSDPKTAFITNTYSKEKGSWKLLFANAIQQ